MIKLKDFYKILNYANPVLIKNYVGENLYQNKGRENLLGCKYEYQQEEEFLSEYGEHNIYDFYYSNRKNFMIIELEEK